MLLQCRYKKIRKYQTRILSHRNDNFLFLFMLFFTVSLSLLLFLSIPHSPKSMPSPVAPLEIDAEQYYDLTVDRSIAIGQLSLEGWLNFERIEVMQAVDDESLNLEISIAIQSKPSGEFRLTNMDIMQNAQIVIGDGSFKVTGKVNDINSTMSHLEYRPACIFYSELEMNISAFQKRIL